MSVTEQTLAIRGHGAQAIARSIEEAVRSGSLRPGDRLPTVRALAADLGVSPATVAAAYRSLRLRGVVGTGGRRGTRVSHRPPVAPRLSYEIPAGLVDLAGGNPDPTLLPDLRPLLTRVDGGTLYGDDKDFPPLIEVARAQFEADGIDAAHVTVVGGTLDGIERVLAQHSTAGDRIAVEDPGFARVLDLAAALGLACEPVAIDDLGMRPDALEAALKRDVAAVVLTPRAQNPTGAAIDDRRAAELAAILARHPEALVLEDDHAGAAAGAPAVTVTRACRRWAVVRSVSKTLGPDLRCALLAGDEATVGRVEGRQALGTGWVSHILQETVAVLLADPSTAEVLERAARSYAARRAVVIDALAERGIDSTGRSGLNVWVPVDDEVRAARVMAEHGWAVARGAPFRLHSPPALRVTIATLDPDQAGSVAEAVARAVATDFARTYSA